MIPFPPTLPSPKLQRDSDEELQAYQEYEEIALTLPRCKIMGPFPSRKYENFFYPEHLVSTTIAVQSTFQPRPSDVILATQPKSGTTWLKSIIYCIVNRARFAFDDDHPLLHSSPHDLFPFLHSLYENRTLPIDLLASMPSPRLLATHNPLSSLPASVVDSGCRVVYLCRDPKDTFVSLWHYLDQTKPTTIEIMSFEESFELFCEGNSGFGPVWDHALEYWEESLINPGKKVMFLKYEDMMENAGATVRKLAGFLEMQFTEGDEKEGVAEEIVRFCSFEKMRNVKVNKEGTHGKSGCHAFSNSAFFRKGKVGDWKEYMSEEMARRLDDIVEKKLHGSGLTFRK